MKLAYVYIDQYREPIHIQTHIHNCFELVYYHHTVGYTTWKKSTQNAVGPLVFTEKEQGNYEQLDFSNNSLVFIPPNILHDEKHFTDSQLTAIGFTIDENDDFINFLTLNKPFFTQDKEKKFHKYIKKLEKEYSAHSPFFQEIICLYLKRLLVEMFPSSKNKPEDILDFIKNYIDEHFTQDVKIEDLASKAYYSPDYFCKLFKEKFGITPKAYILEKRIHFAKKLIKTTELSLYEISQLCGFSDYMQFYKFYKKKENISPSEVRNKKPANNI